MEKRPHFTTGESFAILKRIVRYTFPFKKTFGISLLFSLLLALTNMLMPLIIQRFMDDYIRTGKATVRIALLFAITYLSANLFKMVFQYLERYLFTKASLKTVEHIRNTLFTKINTLGVKFFDSTPAGSLVSRLTNDTETVRDFWNVFLAIIEGSFGMVTVLIAMFALNFQISLYFLIFIPIMLFLIWFYQRYSSVVYRTMRERLSQLNSQLNESISGMAIIQQFNQEKRLTREFEKINNAYFVDRKRMVRMNSLLLNPVINMLQTLALVIILSLFSHRALSNHVEIGIIYAFTTYISNFFSPMRMVMGNLSIYQDGLVSSSRILDLMDNTELAPKQLINNSAKITEGAIEFKNVSFAYDQKNLVLKNISFKVNPGETVALVGHTGSGKSSIINLFMRFYDFDEGEITIDGYSIKELPLSELRTKVGLVMQDSFLFYGDIYHNIALLDRNISENDVREAARFVDAEHFIEGLNEQYHAKVIERGTGYSSGEKQLLSFARTIVRKPKILVMDEATANIDTETEAVIQKSLRMMRKGRTTIAIAHRLSTINDADQILVLDHGQIVERGTHDELIAKEGIYYKMYQIQSHHEF
ncbi:MAG TPA: ABC transporter ATP-binding protein [Bavariicoccus seileri]|uniref:ABC transporter ATP-binding protein n=1 Tax=Bavariicoccus seileri TaxID=549685 RepID=A0A3D4S3A5_9ENTE|nr:ABC transporter ATP-binding protein [Bavariicoccus seileri]HCS93315.1 ABC transporter ATP-binding protein [Bavariicoccus seileri]